MNQDALITEVAKRHGVALGNDDPVMILATLNEILAEENAKAQAEVLEKFQKDLLATMNLQTREATGQLQASLQKTLEANRDTLSRAIEDERKGFEDFFRASEIQIERAMAHIKWAALFNLTAATICLLSAL